MGVLARFAFCLAFALGITLATQSAAFAERRIALVIGNGKYENAGVLANPTNDADAVADLFTKAGFDSVDRRRDLGVVEFKRAVREFVDRAASADVAVVYYSGHGLEIGGVNYLIPVDAKLTSVLDMDDEAVSLDRILVAAGHVKKLSLIILDACRENPFHPAADNARVTRGVSMGLAGVGPTVADTLIAFAAKAGSVSYDGDGRNSPFTTALLKYITQPGLDIRLALGKVRDDVLRATNHRQEPYVYGSLGGDNVALVPAPTAAAPSVAAIPPAAPIPAAAPPANADADEASDYRTTERFASLDGWRAFLAIHPDGAYARLARAEVDKLLARQKLEAAKTEAEPMVTARTEVAPPLSPEALCERDEDRLVRLRANPTNEEASQFRQRTELREVAAPTFAADGKPGLRDTGAAARPRIRRPRRRRQWRSGGQPPTAPPSRPPWTTCGRSLPSMRPRRSGADSNASGCAPRRACSWRASISSSRSQARILCPVTRPPHSRRQTTSVRSWRRAIASRRTRPPAIEKSRNSNAFAPIPTGGTRSASLGQ